MRLRRLLCRLGFHRLTVEDWSWAGRETGPCVHCGRRKYPEGYWI